jgi:hypothetical protein
MDPSAWVDEELCAGLNQLSAGAEGEEQLVGIDHAGGQGAAGGICGAAGNGQAGGQSQALGC